MHKSIQRPIDERLDRTLKAIQKAVSPFFPGVGIDNLLLNDAGDHYLSNDESDTHKINDP